MKRIFEQEQQTALIILKRNACFSADIAVSLTTEQPYQKESYRSGHNELHSKCSCPLLGTWVRIPHSPPEILPANGSAVCGLFFFFNILQILFHALKAIAFSLCNPEEPTPPLSKTPRNGSSVSCAQAHAQRHNP